MNRKNASFEGPVLANVTEGWTYYDCYAGAALGADLALSLEPLGVGCVRRPRGTISSAGVKPDRSRRGRG